MIKRLVANFSLYSFAEMFTKGLGFILLPLYTRLLIPADYGILAIVGAIASILLPLITLGARGAIHRFFFQFDDNNKRREFYGALWLFLLLVPLFVLVFFEIIGGVLYKGTFFGVKYHPYISLALWTSYLSLATFTFLNLILRASEKVLLSALLTLSQFLASTFFTILIVFFWIKGAKGVLCGRACGTALIGIVSCFFILRYVKLNFSISHWRSALVYSAPLTTHFIARSLLDISDRFVLQQYTSFTEVGIYNVGYQIGAGVVLVSQAGYNVLLPLYGKLGSNSLGNNGKTYISRIVTYYVLVVTLTLLLIILFTPEIVMIMAPPMYYNATVIIPWVALGFWFMSLCFLSHGILSHIIGDTRWIAIGTICMALMNIGLNLAFVPIFGVIAAAITTAISYLSLLLFISFIANKQYALPYEFGRLLKIFFSASVTYIASNALIMNNIWFRFGGKLILLLVILPFTLYITRFFTTEEENRFRVLLKKIRIQFF